MRGKGNADWAVGDYTKAVELDGRCRRAYSGRARAYATLGKEELARKDREWLATRSRA